MCSINCMICDKILIKLFITIGAGHGLVGTA